ncbi:MAG: patatin-like phospholipase family protein [Ignavibacteriae bacterium]|nr:patatin-like phospholipase family protein [Ignavibacteriota bacterium]
MKKIGITFGSGGARGLAHILMIQAFEELGIKPSIISGSSIGAIVGAAYSSGLTSHEMYDIVFDILRHKNSRFWEIHKKSDITKMFNLIDPGISIGGMLKGDKFVNIISNAIKINNFKDLKIPLKIVATDYWEKKQVILRRGELIPAVRASYSLPGLFAPVNFGEKLLIDGGMVNPLPYDLIKDKCDITIAIDVSANKIKTGNYSPPAWEILFSAFQIMQNSIVTEKLKQSQPDILIKIDIQNVRVHEFYKAENIFQQAIPYKDELKFKIEKLLNQSKNI